MGITDMQHLVRTFSERTALPLPMLSSSWLCHPRHRESTLTGGINCSLSPSNICKAAPRPCFSWFQKAGVTLVTQCHSPRLKSPTDDTILT